MARQSLSSVVVHWRRRDGSTLGTTIRGLDRAIEFARGLSESGMSVLEIGTEEGDVLISAAGLPNFLDYDTADANGVLTVLLKAVYGVQRATGGRRAFKEPSDRPTRAFIIWSHKDERLREELETHLKLLHREKLLDAWTDRRIAPGDEWSKEIHDHLLQSTLFLVLVSSDMLASAYCYDTEMAIACSRHQAGLARIVPIIVRDVDWQSSPLGRFQALPKDGRAVNRGSKAARDAAWKNVAQGIRRCLEQRRSSGRKPSSQQKPNVQHGKYASEPLRSKEGRTSDKRLRPFSQASHRLGSRASSSVRDAENWVNGDNGLLGDC